MCHWEFEKTKSYRYGRFPRLEGFVEEEFSKAKFRKFLLPTTFFQFLRQILLQISKFQNLKFRTRFLRSSAQQIVPFLTSYLDLFRHEEPLVLEVLKILLQILQNLDTSTLDNQADRAIWEALPQFLFIVTDIHQSSLNMVRAAMRLFSGLIEVSLLTRADRDACDIILEMCAALQEVEEDAELVEES